jgi:hypothetical protein
LRDAVNRQYSYQQIIDNFSFRRLINQFQAQALKVFCLIA